MLSKIKRSEITLEEDGTNRDVFWKPDSSSLVILVNMPYFESDYTSH
jgi:hypothetical protein